MISELLCSINIICADVFREEAELLFKKKPLKLRLRGAGGFVSMPALLVLAVWTE